MKDVALQYLPIKTLSYWRFTRLSRCSLSGAYPNFVVSPIHVPKTQTKAQLIGKIFHAQLEKLNDGLTTGNLSSQDFREHFNSVIEKAAQDLSSDALNHFGDIRLWPELNEIYASLKKMFEVRLRAKGNARVYTERTLKSKDGLLLGQLDAFFLDNDGIDLIDYKSGSLSLAETPKEDYVNQLYFYSQLIEENFGQYPRTLTLTGRNLQSMSIEPSPPLAKKISDTMRNTLNTYNEKISTSQQEHLTDPSLDNCLLCDAKAVCSSFWKHAPEMNFPNWNHAVEGIQSKPFDRSRAGGATLTIEVTGGSLRCKTLQITRIARDRFPQISDTPGQPLMFLNVRLLEDSENAIAEASERTIILSVETT